MKCPGKWKESERTILCRTGRVEKSLACFLQYQVRFHSALPEIWDQMNRSDLKINHNNYLLLCELDDSACFDIMALCPRRVTIAIEPR